MTSIRLTCSACRNATSVAASATVLGRGSDGVTSLTLRCPCCRQVFTRLLDAGDADALDLHLALQGPTWFDELVSTGQDTTQPIHHSTDN